MSYRDFCERYMRNREVREALGNIARSTLQRWVERGLFPQPDRLGPNTMGWKASVVEQWISAREPRQLPLKLNGGAQ